MVPRRYPAVAEGNNLKGVINPGSRRRRKEVIEFIQKPWLSGPKLFGPLN
jgi:hypothetical protein